MTEQDCLEKVGGGVDGRVILRWILQKQEEGTMNVLVSVYFKTLSVTQTIQRQMFKKASN